MPTTEQQSREQITITVQKNTAKVIRDAVATGEFASESDFVEASVLDFTHSGISDQELRRQVLPVIEAMERDPTRAIPLEEARQRLTERHRIYISNKA